MSEQGPDLRLEQAIQLIREAHNSLDQAESLIRSYQTKTTTPPQVEPPPSPTSLPARDEAPALAWGKKVNQEFKNFVWVMAEDWRSAGRMPMSRLDGANCFMACMAFETMETFRPDIRPRRRDGSLVSSAVGLIQILEKTAHALGTTTAKLAAMSARKQLEYVWLYFRNFLRDNPGKDLKTLEDVYMVIHWPAAVGLPNDTALYVKGSSAFAANAGLDLNKDGRITKEEAGRLVRQKLAKGLTEEYCG